MLDVPHDPVSEMYQQQLRLLEDDVVALARAMPSSNYDFVPKNGALAGLRTFGEQIKHLATLIYLAAAIVLEERSPYGPGQNDNGPDEIQSKAAILEYLEGALAYARGAMSSLTVENHLDEISTLFGIMPRCAVAASIVYHSYNHYGQMVIYARMNGLAPPNSHPVR
jgi:hypothetical protein